MDMASISDDASIATYIDPNRTIDVISSTDVGRSTRHSIRERRITSAQITSAIHGGLIARGHLDAVFKASIILVHRIVVARHRRSKERLPPPAGAWIDEIVGEGGDHAPFLLAAALAHVGLN